MIEKFERIDPAPAGTDTEMKVFTGSFAGGPGDANWLPGHHAVTFTDEYPAKMPVQELKSMVLKADIDPQRVVRSYCCRIAIHDCKHGVMFSPQVNTGMKGIRAGDRMNPVAKR